MNTDILTGKTSLLTGRRYSEKDLEKKSRFWKYSKRFLRLFYIGVLIPTSVLMTFAGLALELVAQAKDPARELFRTYTHGDVFGFLLAPTHNQMVNICGIAGIALLVFGMIFVDSQKGKDTKSDFRVFGSSCWDSFSNACGLGCALLLAFWMGMAVQT